MSCHCLGHARYIHIRAYMMCEVGAGASGVSRKREWLLTAHGSACERPNTHVDVPMKTGGDQGGPGAR